MISDVYEPGSTFKLLTTAIALEEDVAIRRARIHCTGSIQVGGPDDPLLEQEQSSRTQTLTEAVSNSCNPVFVQLATEVGIDKFYELSGTFGITGTTGIDFPGETTRDPAV